MAKTTTKPNRKPAGTASRRPVKRRSLAQLNAWLTANHDVLLRKARDNCIDLTGKPTFGGTSGRTAAKRKKTA